VDGQYHVNRTTMGEQYHHVVNSDTARVTVPAARNSTAARVSKNEKKTQSLIIMLVEKDYHEIT
jgi:hypothetical protein